MAEEKKKRGWTKRALKDASSNPSNSTKSRKSVYTASGEHKGKEILFPTVRQRGPGLEEMDAKKAYKEAVKRKDYIEFDSIEEANKWGGSFSKQLGRMGKASVNSGLEKARDKSPSGNKKKMTLDDAGKILDRHAQEEGMTFKRFKTLVKDKIVSGLSTAERKINKFYNNKRAKEAWDKAHPKPAAKKPPSGLIGARRQLDELDKEGY